ncbi:MAG: SIMPL domain-containing protein [Kineosporiaceae bacterium]
MQETAAAPGEVSVVGVGTASGHPDVVRVRLAATVVRPTLAEALTASEDAARRVRAELTRFGITGEDAATSELSAHAEQTWTEQQGSRVVGFRAEHGLVVTVRDVAAVGPVLGEALIAGGDDVRLNGVGFEVEDPSALRVTARHLAWLDARARAEQLAALAGRELGEALSVDEPGAFGGGGPSPKLARAMAAGPEMGVEPGRVSVEVALAVRWALR